MPANYTKTIICLANSRKTGGRCVAGKEQDGGVWVRPVSNRPTAEVNFNERRYENGKEPQILDVIEVSLMSPAPHGHQQENHIIDAGCYWVMKRRSTWVELAGLTDNPQTLWANGHSTVAGRNDRVPASLAAQYPNSLLLLKPKQISISVGTPGVAFGNHKKTVRASFLYKNEWYNLRVTDPNIEGVYSVKHVAFYPFEHPCYFCVSLAEAHDDGYCYKLIATIITEQGL